MDPITDKTIPQAGTILSLTVRRGRVDPRTGQQATEPRCFRAIVLAHSPQSGIIVSLGDWEDDGRVLSLSEFNEQIRPHVVAVYGPAPQGPQRVASDAAKQEPQP